MRAVTEAPKSNFSFVVFMALCCLCQFTFSIRADDQRGKIPAEVTSKLAASAASIGPITIEWEKTFSNRLPRPQALKLLGVEGDIDFFLPRSVKLLWDNGRARVTRKWQTHHLNDDGTVCNQCKLDDNIVEFVFDGDRYFVANPAIVNGESESSVYGFVRIDLLDRIRNSDEDRWFQADLLESEFLYRCGYTLPRRPGDFKQTDVRSRVLSTASIAIDIQVERTGGNNDRLKIIALIPEPWGLDPKRSVPDSLLRAYPEPAKSMQTNIIRARQALFDKTRRVEFTLDPVKQYAIVECWEFDHEGKPLFHELFDNWRQVGTTPLNLPTYCTVDAFAAETAPMTRSDKVIFTAKYRVTRLATDPLHASDFLVTSPTGTQVTDYTQADPTQPNIPLRYRIPAQAAELARTIQLAKEERSVHTTGVQSPRRYFGLALLNLCLLVLIGAVWIIRRQ